MYLLDTNVVSVLDARRRQDTVAIINWIDRNGPSLFLSVVTLTEMQRGILKLRREERNQRADGLAGLLSAIILKFGDRILAMDKDVALHVAKLDEKARAFNPEMADLIIGATADVHGLIVMTRNIRHFSPMGVKVLDPFAQLPAGS